MTVWERVAGLIAGRRSLPRRLFRAIRQGCASARPAGSWPRPLGHAVVTALLGIAATGLWLAVAAPPALAAPPPGSSIVNSAKLFSGINLLNQSLVTVKVPGVQRTDGVLTFYAYRPGSDPAEEVTQPTEFRKPDGTFGLLAPPLYKGTPLPLGGILPLVEATQEENLLLKASEPLFLTVADNDQNLDPAVAETVLVTITGATGDSEVLRLIETGPNTGVFTGYLMTTTAPGASGDGFLYVTAGSLISGRYTDAGDNSDFYTDIALVDPYGIVFDSQTGEPLDGATVTLFNVGTNSPATVFADDGVSPYPSTVTTGDAAYAFLPGGFRFPYVVPGTYRLVVVPPADYSVPTTVSNAQLLAVRPGSSLVIGSRGENFLVNPGPALHIDIPADPRPDNLWLQKFVSDEQATVGDFLQYRLVLENLNGVVAAPAVRIDDRLPLGFRYQSGSARIADRRAGDPAISGDGRTLTFPLGDVAAGTTIEVSYVVEVAVGAKIGKAVNLARATDGNGAQSNQAKATVEVTELFFRDKSFLLGRVLAGSCEEPDTALAGLPGVRLYLEDGSYVVTDQDGKYHFEGIDPGTHVVQVDTLSLPPGYAMIACDESNQSAGRDFSRFVDLKGGTLWQVNFHAAPLPVESLSPDVRAQLDAQAKTQAEAPVEPEIVTGLLSPGDGKAVNRIEAVRIRLDSKLKPRLTVDGQEISAERIGFRMTDPKSKTTLYTYIGVDFGEPGTRKLLVEGIDPFGNARFKQEAGLIRTGEIVSIRLLESAENLADGRTPVRIRVELIDSFGRKVQSAASLALQGGDLLPLGTPPRGKEPDLGLGGQGRMVNVDPQGWISFNPVDKSGRYPIRLAANQARLATDIFVKPAMRDWILVGFAEGTVGYNNLSGNQVNLKEAGIDEHFYQDDQVKFFAKGAIKGEWLLTMAYDSKKPNRDGDSLHQAIDPDSYYPLYGDGTQQGYEAASARKLYVKIERDQFYALFGDMQTGLTQTELSQYSRSMNGFKSELQTEKFSYTLFAADTRQAFAKDEIRGDGTSGRYYLTQKNLVTNSETVTIETRDRFHSEKILDVQTLGRHSDYDIDYDNGSLFFKRPVTSKDANFNPIFIVVRYETLDSSEENLNYGGRVAAKLLEQKVEIGASYVHEARGSGDGDLYGTDLTVKLTPQTTLHAEAATTTTRHFDSKSSGDAYLAEVKHDSERVAGRVYYREQQAGFGLGQQNDSEGGTRKYGVESTYAMTPKLSASGLAYHEDQLGTGGKRDVAEVQGRYNAERYSLSSGLREARDQMANGDKQNSLQWLAGGSWSTENRRLTLRSTYEQSLAGSDENSAYPTLLTLGADYKLSEKVSVFAEQEFSWGAREDSMGTRAGFRSTPWQGGTLNSSVERQFNENGQRVFALFGLGQSWQISERWSIDGSLDRSHTLKQPGNDSLNSNVPPAHGTADDFTAVSLGATYKRDKWTWWNRLEVRQADSEDKLGVSTSIVGEPRDGVAVSAKAMAFITDASSGLRSTDGNLRLGLAYRPATSPWIFLNRLDFYFDQEKGGTERYDSWRIVNNFHANFRLSNRLQTSFYSGLKYVRDTFSGDHYDSVTSLLAFEARYNLNRRWDIGVHGGVLHSWNSDTFDYTAGASLGYSPLTNTWVSLGYNFVGFRDDDFATANYTAQGAYLRFRAKFDQQSVREAAEWINK